MTARSITLRLTPQVIAAAQAMAASYEDAIGNQPAQHFLAAYLNVTGHYQALWQATAHLGLNSSTTLLEFGSGMGTRCLLANGLYGCRVLGLEPAQHTYAPLISAIPALLHANPELNYTPLASSKESTGLLAGSIDAITCFEVLEHVTHLDVELREMRRLLRPGGRVVLSTANYGSFYEGHYRLPWLPLLGPRTAPTWIRRFGGNPAFLSEINFITWRQLRDEASTAGFRIIPRWPARSTNPAPILNVLLEPPDTILPPHHSPNTWLQSFIQRPIPNRALSLFGMHYKIYAELIAC